MPREVRNQNLEEPSSDFSSIEPSQSASQIGHQLPEAVPNTGSAVLSDDKGDFTMRPHSVSSTAASSLYYTPAMPATYKTETVTYAPAISLVVPRSLPSSPVGSDITTPLALGPSYDGGSLGPPTIIELSPYTPDTEMHTKMHIPAAHSINEYEIPTAEAIEPGTGSGTWRHSRGDSQEGLTRMGYSSPRPQKTSLAPTSHPTSGPNVISSNMSSSTSTTTNFQRHVLGHRITEEDLPDNNPLTADLSRGGGQTAPTRVVGSALIEVFDDPANDEEDEDELPVEVEDQMIKQGKLAVVENPRFMSQERKRELERERMRLAAQEHQSDEPEKKSFPFLHQHHRRAGTHSQSDTGHVTFTETSAVPSTPPKTGGYASNSLPKTSPSKRFFGSLKGLFGVRQPASPQVSSQVQDSSPSRLRGRSPSRVRTVDSDVDFVDDSDNDSPTKTGSGFQALLRGTGAKTKVGSAGGGGGTRWSTRTDKNIKKLTRSGDDDDDYDTYLSQNVGKGAAGDVVVKAGLVGSVITGARGVRKRSASDIGTAPVVASGSTTGVTKKLKKNPAPASMSHPSHSTQQKDSGGAAVHAHTSNPSTPIKKSTLSADAKPAAPGRSVSLDQSAGRTSVVQQSEVGQTPVDSGGGKEVIVDLGKRRRTISGGPPLITTTNPPVDTSARGMPVATRTSKAGISAVSKGYSSDTAAAVPGQAGSSKKKSVAKNASPTAASIPAAVTSTVASAAPTVTPSKPTLTRQPSVGKTQTPTTPNIPVDNINIKAGGSHKPQPHRQHSTSSSGGAAIVLPAGGTNPTGTLISQPGWDAQSLPTGGGLSRNNSVLSGVSAPVGGSGGGGAGADGMSKAKKQKKTVLGHGMGSGVSVGRKGSLGSSSGRGGSIGSVVQPTQPAQSLMSIVEDVAKHNREWSQESSELLKNRKKIVSGLAKEKLGLVEMVDVVKAPPRAGRDELAQLAPAVIKARVTETPTAVSSTSGGGGRLVDIKAPGSVFDQRKATDVGSTPAVRRQATSSMQSQQANVTRKQSVTAATSTPATRDTKRPAKSPLRSAMKNPSRTPSPLPGPFLVPQLQKQQQALQQGFGQSVKPNGGVVAPVPVLPAQFSTFLGPQTEKITSADTMTNGRPASRDSAPRRRKGKRQIKGASDEAGEAGDSTSTNDTGNEVFYTDDDGEAAVVSSTHMEPLLNGHAVGSSDLSGSTTSTAAVHHPPPTTTSSASQLTTTSAPRRRKSVRVSLQPTFSPPPPVDDDEEEEEQKYRQKPHVHAPIPVAAGSSSLPVPRQKAVVAPEPSVYDIWQNSSDEDVEYKNAKRLLTRAARKEKDMNVFAAASGSR